MTKVRKNFLIYFIFAFFLGLISNTAFAQSVELDLSKCFDSDEGRNADVPGIARAPDGTIIEDKCISRGGHYYDTVVEAVCDGDKIVTEEISCPESRCFMGRCVPRQGIAPAVTCNLDFKTNTITLPNGNKVKGACLPDGQRLQWYCSSDYYWPTSQKPTLFKGQCNDNQVCRNGVCELLWNAEWSKPPYNWQPPQPNEKKGAWGWCRDTDGDNALTKGYMLDEFQAKHQKNPILIDRCIEGDGRTKDRVQEFVCTGGDGGQEYKFIECPDGYKCGDGACVPGEQPKKLTKEEKFRLETPSPLTPGKVEVSLPSGVLLASKVAVESGGCDKAGGRIDVKEFLKFYVFDTESSFLTSPSSSLKDASDEWVTATDFCLGPDKLVEYVCTGTETGMFVVGCQCSDGTCPSQGLTQPAEVPVSGDWTKKWPYTTKVLATPGSNCQQPSVSPTLKEFVTITQNGQEMKLEDKCASPDELVQYTCADKFFAGEIRIQCPCEDGICIKRSPVPLPSGVKFLEEMEDTTSYTSCDKLAFDIDFFKKQKRSMNAPLHSFDVCHDDKQLEEFYCKSAKLAASVVVECEGSCVQGRCVSGKVSKVPEEGKFDIPEIPEGATLKEKKLYIPAGNFEPRLSCNKVGDYFKKDSLLFDYGEPSQQSVEDICLTKDELGEILCIGDNYAGWAYVKCPCESGACIRWLMQFGDVDIEDLVTAFNENIKDMPDAVKQLIGTERIEFIVELKQPKGLVAKATQQETPTATIGMNTENGKIVELTSGEVIENPTMRVKTRLEVLEKLRDSADTVNAFLQVLSDGSIELNGLTVGASAKLSLAKVGLKVARVVQQSLQFAIKPGESKTINFKGKEAVLESTPEGIKLVVLKDQPDISVVDDFGATIGYTNKKTKDAVASVEHSKTGGIYMNPKSYYQTYWSELKERPKLPTKGQEWTILDAMDLGRSNSGTILSD